MAAMKLVDWLILIVLVPFMIVGFMIVQALHWIGVLKFPDDPHEGGRR